MGDTFGNSGVVGQLAETLIGFPLAPMRTRGLYVIVPLQDAEGINPITNPHVEAHAVQLISMCYLDRVEPQGGGLLVWPGSHREIYPAMGSKLEHIATPAHLQVFQKWKKHAPIELHGEKGDVIIIHHRLMHAPSLNRSNRLRFGFLCDYERSDSALLCRQVPNAIWDDWPAISSLPESILTGPSDFSLPPLPNGPEPIQRTI